MATLSGLSELPKNESHAATCTVVPLKQSINLCMLAVSERSIRNITMDLYIPWGSNLPSILLWKHVTHVKDRSKKFKTFGFVYHIQ